MVTQQKRDPRVDDPSVRVSCLTTLPPGVESTRESGGRERANRRASAHSARRVLGVRSSFLLPFLPFFPDHGFWSPRCCSDAGFEPFRQAQGLNSVWEFEATVMSSPMVLSLLLFASLTALLLLAPRLSPPLRVPVAPGGEDDEEELPAGGAGLGEDLAPFRRATLDAGAATPPKVAFLFLTTSDLALAPLWERFFAGHEGRFTVYVHADPSSRLRLRPTRSFRGRFVPARPTRRADPSLIAAARRLLSAALLDDPANAYFALLSQSCVPLHSFPRLYRALFPPAATPPRHRALPPSYIEALAGEPQLPSRYAARGGEAAMLPEVPYARFRVGSQFFALARRHAALVVRERRLWRKFRAPCRPEARDHECYPEEHYFPTLLDMADPAGIARFTLTRVNWTGSVAGHPYTYAAAEVTPRLVAELRASNHSQPYMFARKFAPDCLGPLMDMADSVIFKD